MLKLYKMRLFTFIIILIFSNMLRASATTYTWVGAASGNWNTATNWSPSTGYPGKTGSTDVAQFNNSTYNVTLSTPITLNNINQNSGTCTLTITTAGNSLTISSGISLANNSSSIKFLGSGAVSIAAISFQNGDFLTCGSPTDATTNVSFGLACFITLPANGGNGIFNYGTLNFSFDVISFGSASVLTNYSTGTVTTNFSIFQLSNNNNAINNYGVFNASLLNTFQLSNNPSYINNYAGATFTAGSSTFQLSGSGAVISNAGTFNVSGGCSFQLSGNDSYISNASTGVFTDNGSTYTISGANSDCQIKNSGTYKTTSCSLTFSGSNNNLTNNSGGTFTDNGSSFTFSGVNNSNQLLNSGTFTGSGSNITLQGNNSNLTNNASSSFEVNGGGIITCTSTGSSVNKISNSGTFNAGTSNSACEIILDNYASLSNSASGTFNLGSTSFIHYNTTTSHNINITNAGGGTFTLQSDAYGTGAIDQIPQGQNNTVSGTFTVQRYLQGGAGYRAYRLLSSPVYVATVGSANVYSINYLKNSIYLTGTTTTGGFDNTVAANPTLYLYRENQSTPAFTTYLNSNFIGIKAINNATAYAYSMNDATYTSTYNIPVGSGYLCFFRGNRSTSFASKTTAPFPVPENTTLSTSGTLNTGTITFRNWFNPGTTTLSYTPATPVGYRGFNLAGNPYPSTIDWQTYQNTAGTGIYGNGISTSIYELNPKTQNYDVYQYGGAFTNHGSRYIVSGQAFFVLATGATSSLTFYETAKAASQENTGLNLFMGTPNAQTASDQHLKLQMALDTVNIDDTFIGLGKNLNPQYDPMADALYKSGSGKVALSSLSADNIGLAINKQPLPKGSTSIKLNVNAQTDGIYSLNLKEVTGVPQLYDIWLMDAYKKDSLDMRHNLTYRFNVYKSDTNSFGANRFKLVIRENAALAYHLLGFTAVKTANQQHQVQITWAAENEQNYTNFTVERSVDGGITYQVIGSVPSSGAGNYGLVDNNPSTNNLYRLQSQNVDDQISFSPVVPISYSGLSNSLAKSNINVYPNPTTSTINLGIASALASTSKFNIQISNSSGLMIRQVTTTALTWQTDVTDLQPGTYLIRVIDGDHQTEIGNTKFVKM